MQLSARAESRVIANQITRGGGVSIRGTTLPIGMLTRLDPKIYYLHILYPKYCIKMNDH